jgi:nucleoside-diphosphate-sugar epimerase
LDKIILKQDLSFTQGNQVYDFLYGRDAAIGIRLVAELGTKKNYYLGSGNPKPLKDFIKDIIQTTSFNGNSTFGKLPFEGVDFPLSFLSIEKLVSDTGFLPKVNFSEGINKVYLSRKRNLNE